MGKNLDEQTVDSWILLNRVNRQLLEDVGIALKSAGMPPLDWYDVLLELNRIGEGGLRQYEISGKVLLNKHNLSRLLDRLEKEELVMRRACAEDGRGNRVLITAEGRRTLKRMWPVYRAALQEHFSSRISEGDRTDLSRILGRLLREHA